MALNSTPAKIADKIGQLSIDVSTPPWLEKLKGLDINAMEIPMPSPMVIGIFFVILVIIAFRYIRSLQSVTAKPENVQTVLKKQTGIVQGIVPTYYRQRLDASSILRSTPKAVGEQVASNEDSLINFAPLTVQDTGYLGPLQDGVFAEKDAVQMALRAGARCFILNIDYHEDQGLPYDLFGNPDEPRLLYRDVGGVIRSINAGDIKLVAQSLADMAFSNVLPNRNDPLFVVLFFKKTPPVKSNQYVPFLSKVAEKLEPLLSYHLGQTPQGDYHRQGKQNELMYQPISYFEKKVIFISNVDTSAFRTVKPPYVPSKDLDYLVNLRIFKDTVEDMGATSPIDEKVFARSTMNTINSYVIIPTDKQSSAIDSTKLRWSMAIGPSGTNPSLAVFSLLTRDLGVQSIPLWIFDDVKPTASTLQLMKSDKPLPAAPAAGATEQTSKEDLPVLLTYWKQASFMPKPKAIRFVRPDPIVPKQPSPKLDSNQGRITTPTI
jgi:hypothetical protein